MSLERSRAVFSIQSSRFEERPWKKASSSAVKKCHFCSCGL